MNTFYEILMQELLDEEFDALDAVHSWARTMGWEKVVHDALVILGDLAQVQLWPRAITVCYQAIPRCKELPSAHMEIVARLYWCLINYPSDAPEIPGDIVWCIAKELKGVGYESEWDPMKDPEVCAYLAAMD
jgi:hypothetical protein